MGDELRSLDARVARLTAAVEKSCKAQIASAEWCAEAQSDIGTLMAEVREMRARVARARERRPAHEVLGEVRAALLPGVRGEDG